MNKAHYLIFYTKTPNGPDYLSISILGENGLIERKVFPVVGEPLDSTPHIEGAETKRLFIVKGDRHGLPMWLLTAMSFTSCLLALAMFLRRVL